MSAIGSVIVMASTGPSSLWFPWGPTASFLLPTALCDARQLAAVRHFAEAHAAQAELAVYRVRPATTGATGVAAHLELLLAVRFID